MKLSETYAPTSLDEIIGQPQIVKRLRAFVLEPYPTWMAFVGPTGTGKTTCAKVLSDLLADWAFGMPRIYRESGAKFDAKAVEHYFGSDSPFRYAHAANHFSVLRLEELERMPDVATVMAKDAYDVCLEHNWKVLVLATSNNLAGLKDQALIDRFGEPFVFDDGPAFAKAFCDWMQTVWMLESEEPIPPEYPLWGFDDGCRFSGRRALDRLESALLQQKARMSV